MNVRFADIKEQYRSLKPEMDAAIQGVIDEMAFIGGGENSHVTTFERQFEEYLGVPHAIACANGTDAIEIALKAAGISVGDEVIVPAISWISTSEAVSNIGATPVFVDVEDNYNTIDSDLIKEKITAKTKAIIPVHLYGCPAQMKPIMALAAEHALFVLEDSAQAHGAQYDGSRIGTIGHAASFSFYPGKNLGAYGDAGGIVTKDEELARKMKMMTNHGQLQKHDHQMEGRNSRMDGIQAAVLNVKLKYIDQWNKARQDKASKYRESLQNSLIRLPSEPSHGEHVYHLFVVRTNKRDALKRFLNEKGVQTAIHYPSALPFLEPYKDSNVREDFPVASKAQDEILSLPMYPELPDEHIDYVCEMINQFSTDHN